MWGVSAKSPPGGWSVPAAGATGPIKHASGFCINGQTKKSTEYELTSCTGAAIQDFVLESNGNLHMAGGGKYCLAVEDFNGPGVVSWQCNTGTNEEMAFDAATGSICDKGGANERCLDAKPAKPAGGGGGGGGGGDTVQIWAKPQPNGAVAVLVINAGDDDNVVVPFSMSEVRFSHSGAASVLNIWTGKTTAAPAGDSYTTDSIAPHDSRFYLFSPADPPF